METALRTAKKIFSSGTPELWSSDEFSNDDITATVSLVGTPSNAGAGVEAEDTIRSLDLLQDELAGGKGLACINSNENGAETSINGWLHSAMTGLPVLDLACNGRAHPTSLMGSMGLHLNKRYQSLQGFAGGTAGNHIEGFVRGSLESTSSLIRHASSKVGGFIAVSRNPTTIDYAVANGSPKAISSAIELGRMYLDSGINAILDHLDARIVAEGNITNYSCIQREGLDVGMAYLDDKDGTAIHFVNEYMLLEKLGKKVTCFPDLVMTFSNGKPIISADLDVGTNIQIMVADRSRLLLSGTMTMPDLYRPINILLGKEISPYSLENPREGSMD